MFGRKKHWWHHLREPAAPSKLFRHVLGSENVLSSRTKDSGRKVPRTIIIIIIDQVEMDEQEGDDGGVILQLAEEELKRLTNLLDPKADSDASSAKDDLEDCSDLGSVRKAVVRAAGYACDQPVVFLLPE